MAGAANVVCREAASSGAAIEQDVVDCASGPPDSINSDAMADRESVARAALGSLHLEGLEPSPEMRAAVARWVRGEADIEELLATARRTAEAKQPAAPSAAGSPR